MPQTAPQEPTVKETGPGFMVVSISPLRRDDEVWIEYAMERMGPKFAPDRGTTYAAMMGRGMKGPNPDDYKNYVFADVHEAGRSGVFLIFVQPILAASNPLPSEEFPTTKNWSWDAFIRTCNVRPIIGTGGNLIGVDTNDTFVVEETKALCDATVRVWWTFDDWSPAQLGDTPITPGWVTQRYANGQGFSKYALHDEIRIQGASGILKVNGQPVNSNTANTPSRIFPATSPPTWRSQIATDDVEYVRGRKRRIQIEVDPPFDPRVYPKSPFQDSA